LFDRTLVEDCPDGLEMAALSRDGEWRSVGESMLPRTLPSSFQIAPEGAPQSAES